jgi:alpha-glucosidase
VPIYVRAGAILPMRSQVEQYVGELASNPLDINIYPGPDSKYVMYQDDGITSNAETLGQFRTTEISHQRGTGVTNVRLRRLTDAYRPPEPFYTVTLPGTQQPSGVTAGAAIVPKLGSAAALAASATDGFRWDSGLQTTIIKVFDTAADVTISVAD